LWQNGRHGGRGEDELGRGYRPEKEIKRWGIKTSGHRDSGYGYVYRGRTSKNSFVKGAEYSSPPVRSGRGVWGQKRHPD